MLNIFITRRRVAALVLLLGLASRLAADATGWPLATPDLRPDPAWQWGTLPNGLRYVVRQNALPAGRVSYRLAVEVGSACEEKSEQGFAHFVEHMAFNGTRRFPGETLPQELERRGLGFGPESNAFTFLTHTLYQFDAPGNTPEDIDWIAGVLREFADGLTFEARQVKRERGVIEAENRERTSVSRRFDLRRRRELYPLSPLSHSIEDQPAAATAEKLRTFYRKWYRPEKMIVALVGDAPVAVLEAAVRRQFSSLPARSDPAPRFDPGPVENPAVGTTSVVHDPEGGGLWLEIVSVMPPRSDGLAERRRIVAANLATQVLTERLSAVAREKAGAFHSAGARILATTPHAFETNVFVQTNSTEWQDATTALARELRRTLELTLYPSEVADAKARILRGSELAVASAATASSTELVGWVVQEALWKQISIGPVENLRVTRELLPQIDVFEVASAWRSFWQANRASLFGYGFFPVLGGDRLVSRAFADESATPLQPPPRPKPVAFPYTEFGPPGEIRTRRHDATVDLHLLEFANGVRVSLKRTPFSAHQVDFAADLGTGLLSAPPYKAALAPLAANSLLNGGVARLTPEELHRIFSVEPVSLRFDVNEGAFTFSGGGPPDRLDLLLRLFCAYLTDARWDSKAITRAKTDLIGTQADLQQTAEGTLKLRVFNELTLRDARYRTPDPAELSAIDAADLRNWLDPVLRGAPLDLALVGDFDPEEIVPVLTRTVGALPVRESPRIEQFPVHFAKQGAELALRAPPFANRTALQFLWSADQGRDIHASRRLEVIAAALENRLVQRVREDLGAAYSPSTDYWRTHIGTEEGYVLAYVATAPKLAAKVRKLVLQEADQIAQRGITAAELAAALPPIIARTHVQLKDNAYWLWNIALRAQRRPEVLTWPLTRTSEFERLQLAEVNALAREVLPKSRAFVFIAAPDKR